MKPIATGIATGIAGFGINTVTTRHFIETGNDGYTLNATGTFTIPFAGTSLATHLMLMVDPSLPSGVRHARAGFGMFAAGAFAGFVAGHRSAERPD